MIIFAIITLAAGFTLSTAMRTQAAVRNRSNNQQELRGIAAVLQNDLRYAYAATGNPNTMFVSGGTVNGSLLTFTTLSGRVIPSDQGNDQGGPTGTNVAGIPQSDLHTITYAHDPQTGILTRIESIVPGTDAAAQAANDLGSPQTILSRRIRNISFEFYDPTNQNIRQDWTYQNDPNQAQGGGSQSGGQGSGGQGGGAQGGGQTSGQTTDTTLPQSVHVEIELAGDDGRIVSETLVIPIATPTPMPAGQAPAAPATANPGGSSGGNKP